MNQLNELHSHNTELDNLVEKWLTVRHRVNDCFSNFLLFVGGSLSLNESEGVSTNEFAEIELSKIEQHIHSMNNYANVLNKKTDDLVSDKRTPVLSDYAKMNGVIQKLSNNTENYRNELKQQISRYEEIIDDTRILLNNAKRELSELDNADDNFMDFVDNYNHHTFPDKRIELGRKR